LLLIGDGSVFRCIAEQDTNDPCVTRWHLIFYGCFWAMSFTLPKAYIKGDAPDFERIAFLDSWA
jgi:hypothetical protein